MKQRIIWGFVFGIVLIGVFISRQPYLFIAATTAICMLCLQEFFKMVADYDESFAASFSFYNSFGVTSGAAIVLIFQLIAYNKVFPQFAWIALLLLWIVFIYELLNASKGNVLANCSYFALTIIYIVAPLALSSYLAFEHGNYYPWRIFGLFILIWTSDTMQYFSGKFLGKHKLYEQISPNKTWEGTIGGVIFTIVAGYILSHFIAKEISYSAVQWMTIAALVAVFGSVGDLVESMFKRQMKVKDSGSFLPGHGGALDRFDSFIFVLPFVVVYWMMVR